MAQRNEMIAYALDFASYLISKIESIDRIVLYGSVARGDFHENSDIDLFVDSREKIDKKAQKIVNDYYETKKFKEWKLKGVSNKISVIAGDLDSDEWKSLKRSIINNGIILFGKYKEKPEKTSQYVLFSFENIKPESKRVSIFRKLFGFKAGKKRYSGIAEKMKAIKIGKGSMIVPAEYSDELKRYFQDKKISARLIDLWSDAEIA